MQAGTDAAALPRVRWWHSLRLRIAAAVAAVAIVVSLMIGVVVDQAAAADGRERLRSQALDRLDAAVAFYDSRGVLRFGATMNDERLPTAMANGTAADHQVSWYDGSTMFAAQRLDQRQVLSVTLPGAELAAQRTALRLAWAQAAGVGAALSAALGWLVGTWLSRRLRAGAAAATAIAGGDPQRRAAQPGRDEVALLTSALDRMAQALQRRLQIERHFTADVAHELRSPVTGLVSAAELLPRDEISDLVRRQVGRLRRLVEDLLEISRLDAPDDRIDWQDCDLAAVVEGCLQGDLAAAQLEVVGDGGDGGDGGTGASATVRGEPRRIERIVTNLVRNALTYGAAPVRVRIEGPRIVVADAGPGFPQELLDDGPRRFATFTRGKGSGLGLTIVAKHVEALGGTLELSNDDGARAQVEFPTA